jgi:hypothetical protein
MAVINFAHREITAKVVYFGATGAGCNTNVRRLHELLADNEARSRLHKFGPGDTDERSWYFDVRGPHEAVAGFTVRFRIYSMPGGLVLPAHRREVMDQVDAIVLVVDARPAAASANEQALLELEQILADQGLELAAMPVVLQVNHTDHPEARELAASVFDLNPYGFPVISAAARSDVGVRATFDEITATTVARVRDNMAGGDGSITLTAVHRPEVEHDGDIIRKHLDAIQEESPATPSSSVDEPAPTAATPPGAEVEVPFQPREFAGSHPIRVVEAAIEDGQVFVDLELERMGGGGPTRQLRVRLANRPTDSPAVPRAPQVIVTSASPAMRVTEGLPDRVEMHGYEIKPDLPPVWYGVLGVSGGLAAGLAIGFILFT